MRAAPPRVRIRDLGGLAVRRLRRYLLVAADPPTRPGLVRSDPTAWSWVDGRPARLVAVARLGDGLPDRALARALAVAASRRGAATLVVGAEPASRRLGPLLASGDALSLEAALGGPAPPLDVSLAGATARGGFCEVGVKGGVALGSLAGCLRALPMLDLALLELPAKRLVEAITTIGFDPDCVVLEAELPQQRALAALAVADLQSHGLRVRVWGIRSGAVARARALAGIEPGGEISRRCERCLPALLGPLAR